MKIFRIHCSTIICGLSLLALGMQTTGAWADTANVVPLTDAEALRPVHVKAATVTYKGREALRVTEDLGQKSANARRFVILDQTDFQDGTIEVELTGEPAADAATAARGFVGIAFHVAQDASQFELIYLRPTNGRANDQLRRNHSIQYDSFPDYPWHRLRKETPGKYESYVDLVSGEWTKIRIEINGTTAKLFVHGADQPSLIVNDLKLGETGGKVALWIGPGTVAHFANLKISR